MAFVGGHESARSGICALHGVRTPSSNSPNKNKVTFGWHDCFSAVLIFKGSWITITKGGVLVCM